jgi:hypothetical protein
MVELQPQNPTLSSAPSPSSSSPISLSQAGSSSSTNQCHYRGVTCFCSMDQHHVNPSLNPSLHLHIDWNCEMLKILGLSFHRYHRYLTCSCGSFLPLNKLVHHYKKDHSDILHDQLKIYANKKFIPLIEHFATSFDILCDQTAVNFTPMTFCGPIAGISPPIKCCTCLAYGVSLKDRYVAKKHWGSSCKKAASSTLAPSERMEECWEQHSFLQGRDPAYMMVPHNLLDNPVPLQPSLPGPSESPAEHTRYLMDWT